MTKWQELHDQSVILVAQAEMAARLGERKKSFSLYRQAAFWEEQALEAMPNSVKAIAITVVSVAALYYKSRDIEQTKLFIQKWRTNPSLDEWAIIQLDQFNLND